MADLTNAVQWWQEEQPLILVLASVVTQLFLIASTSLRKRAIRPCLRILIWLTYLGSDALAVYALAALFNRSKNEQAAGGGNSLLVLLWAPILLMHSGGHGVITAYTIEDNELWMRHVVTAFSQIAVAVYVFCKSWPAVAGDKLLLGAAVLLFLQGAGECWSKPWRLLFGTADDQVMNLDRTPRTSSISDGDGDGPLDRFVQAVRGYVPGAKRGGPPPPADADNNEMELHPVKQALDILSPYDPVRLRLLKSFWVLDDKEACDTLRRGLCNTFDAIYNAKQVGVSLKKLKILLLDAIKNIKTGRQQEPQGKLQWWRCLLAMGGTIMPLVALGLFHKSHKESYSGGAVKLTYALFGCTSACYLFASMMMNPLGCLLVWPQTVAQYVRIAKNLNQWHITQDLNIT
ncbi:hypothetical protein PVAP13_2NG473306 [Panicum virgatum]|uniref:DUF4220 domain-containing protein n=1 Tax=Panicum virgatum TaxID=38727 RepID=A0A8T0VNG4_PANVG|nr:hypothetical protein PVAP13_2NG473306 [Panicum virgatum]